MAAKDYVFKSKDGKPYLVKKTKNEESLSQDNRIIEDKEILGLFSFYFINYCKTYQTDSIDIVIDGKNAIRVNLLDQDELVEDVEAVEVNEDDNNVL